MRLNDFVKKYGLKNYRRTTMKEYERVTQKQGEPIIVSKRVYYRLRELEDKIENGTLIKLPCKVGTTLYFIVTEEQEDINGFKYAILESNKWLYVIDKNEEITIEENDRFFKFEYTYDYTFGENVFLTKAEAEARLKELDNSYKENR